MSAMAANIHMIANGETSPAPIPTTGPAMPGLGEAERLLG